MAISMNWGTKVILVPVTDMTLISGTPGTGSAQVDPALYELDCNVLRLALKDLEDSDDGIAFPTTHNNSGTFTLSGVTYARFFEIINGYKVEFDTGTYDHYTVRLVGANNNVADVRKPNTVSLIIGNTAGMVVSGSGLSTQQSTQLQELHRIHGLESGAPLQVSSTARSTTGINQTIGEAAGTVTVTRT